MYYTARFQPCPGGRYTVRFPDLPEAMTEGHHLEDAMIMAMECLQETLSYRMSEGRYIPKPKDYERYDRGNYMILPIPVPENLSDRIRRMY